MKWQLLEFLKVLAIGFGFAWLFSIIRYFQDGDGQTLFQSIFLFPEIIWLVIANYPVALLWFVWLAWAHMAAVRVKYSRPRNSSRPIMIRLALNRPMILCTGLIGILFTSEYRDSYGITFVLFLEFIYLTYVGVSKITKPKD